MPYSTMSLTFVNEVLGPSGPFDADALLDVATSVGSVAEALDTLGALSPDLVTDDNAAALRRLVGRLPAALDQMILAAVRSALARGLRTQLTWQPGYEYELRAWEVSDGSHGLLNLFLITPHPEELVPPDSTGS
jgi:hypothetical protein